MLTGRARRASPRCASGGACPAFPIRHESPYDTVKTGHGGTSISTAMGFALAWRGQPEDAGRKAVAVIGDGSLQEGNAFEALNHGGTFNDLELVVVLNDNNMSISPSVGALSAYLSRVRSSTWLNARLRTIQRAIKRIPRIGDDVEDVLQRWYHSLQGIIPHHALGIIFEELGFFYYGPIDGHDIDALRRAFRATHWMRRPVLIHAVTRKGRGYKDDVPEITCYHAAQPSKMVTAGAAAPSIRSRVGRASPPRSPSRRSPWPSATRASSCITAAMLEGTGLVKFQQRFPDRCLDVGMAEQHAVGAGRRPGARRATGRSAPSTRPSCSAPTTSSSRRSRCRRRRCCSASIAAAWSAPTARRTTASSTSPTCAACPTSSLMAPRDTGELAADDGAGADRATGRSRSASRAAAARGPTAQLPHVPFAIGEAERVADGDDGCILAYGPMVYTALEVRRRIRERPAATLAVVNARFAKPLDERLIAAELARQPVVFTLEDHVARRRLRLGGARVRARGRAGLDANALELLALPDRFIDHGQRSEQLAEAGLDVDHVIERITAPARGGAPGAPVRLVTGAERTPDLTRACDRRASPPDDRGVVSARGCVDPGRGSWSC